MAQKREEKMIMQPFVFILATLECDKKKTIRSSLSKKHNLSGPVLKTPGRYFICVLLPFSDKITKVGNLNLDSFD